MEHRKSEEQQSYSAQDNGEASFHSDVEGKKGQLENQDESVKTNPKCQTLFTQNMTASEERESDVLVEGASHCSSTSSAEMPLDAHSYTTYLHKLLHCLYGIPLHCISPKSYKPPDKVFSTMHRAPSYMKMQQDSIFLSHRLPSQQGSAPTTSSRSRFLGPPSLPGKLQDSLTPICNTKTRGEGGSIFTSPLSLIKFVGQSLGLSCGVTHSQLPDLAQTTSNRSKFLVQPMLPDQLQDSSTLQGHFHSIPSLSKLNVAKNNLTQAMSLPDMLLEDSFEEFTPDITFDENEETYSFHCSRPGLYQCSVTGLVFHMEGEGDVVYRIVSWNRRLLAQHHKKPAGPLFDIKCLQQQSVCQLHLPHCEIRSTGGCGFLSVAHVNDEDIEFITPHKITETHVIINITHFSGFGVVKDEDSPPGLLRALVLLFYRPPTDPDPESVLNVLLLPKNVVLRDVKLMRKKLVGDEGYIETPGHCKLVPNQEYTLSTSPEDDSVLVQPTDTEFDEESYDNYVSSFQVNLEKIMKNIKLFLRDTNSSQSVWERKVCLLSTGVRRTCGPSALTLPSNERLMEIRTCFINGISGPVLKSLVDKLFEKKVITDSERESAEGMQSKSDKARFVIDIVRKKGETASSEMIEFLCEVDPFLCEHLGLI